MSDLQSASAALNVPEDLLQRSAAARAQAAGTSTDAILAAWAGGAPAPTITAPADTGASDPGASDPGASDPGASDPGASDAGASDPGASDAGASDAGPSDAGASDAGAAAPATGGSTASPVTAESVAQTGAPAPAAQEPSQIVVQRGPVKPPILESERQRPFLLLAGAAAVFALAIVAGFVVPSLPEDGNGIYTSEIQMTQNAIDGKQLYASVGCASCHTQMVRPIAVDAGLGGVTMSDTNQVLGVRRLGPDLAHIGTRVTDAAEFDRILTAVPDHPSYAGLSEQDLQHLADYLRASR